MNRDVLRHLRCPLCGQPLTAASTGATTALRCPRGHSFDIAKQGYVNLTVGRSPHSGDTAQMVAAREEFLTAGHYDLISTALAWSATGPTWSASPAYPPLVVDAGAGTGRHLAAVLDALPAAVGLALDVSKPALRRAARAHQRANAALADTWRPLPLADDSAALLLNVFAPRNGAEFHRVLRPDGMLLVVTPADGHLAELVDRLGLLRVDPEKADRVAAGLEAHFVQVEQVTHQRTMRLNRAQVRTLVDMGPSAWHIDPVRLVAQIDALEEPVSVTAAVRLASYQPR